MKLVHEITKEDIGKSTIQKKCPTCGMVWCHIGITDLMGRIMPHDVGKRIYEVSPNVLQVENQEQLKKRLNN